MPNFFLDALEPRSVVTIGKKEQEKKLDSTLKAITRLLTLTFTNTLSRRNHKKKKAAAPSTVPSPGDGSTDNESIDTSISRGSAYAPRSIGAENATATTPQYIASPRRRRKNDQHIDDAHAVTPRKGSKSKQRRVASTSHPPTSVLVSRGSSANVTISPPDQHWYHDANAGSTFGLPQRPTTEFLGWRRLHLHEIVRLKKHAFVIIIIPGNQRSEDKAVKSSRNAFKNRVVSTVIQSGVISADKQRQQNKLANEVLVRENGIKRYGQTVIELPCRITSFPKRDEYIDNLCSKSDVERDIAQGAGMNIELMDYPSLTDTLLKWSEINAIQVFCPYYRGDLRPQVDLEKEELSEDYSYCDDLAKKLDIVRGDVIQTLELALTFEKRKSKLLKRRLVRVNSKLTDAQENTKATMDDLFEEAIQEELADSSLTNFAYNTNKEYNDAWYAHYTWFQPNVRLLCEMVHKRIYESIRKSFPLHYLVFRSLIFSKQSHEPKRRVKQGYQEKQKALVNQFCAMVRIRHPGYLLDWAVVGTMAMFSRGAIQRQFRNTVLKAFSCGLNTAFRHLDKIWLETKAKRDKLIQKQVYVHHGSDNMQQYHSFATQRQNTPGIMHTGMVFNIIQAREYLKPQGTKMKDPSGNIWIVESSSMPDYWTCKIELKRVVPSNPEGDEDNSVVTCSVTFPELGWNIVSLPNTPTTPANTYLDQQIRPSIRMRVPKDLSDAKFVMGTRSWNHDDAGTEVLDPRRYHRIVLAVRRQKEFIRIAKIMKRQGLFKDDNESTSIPTAVINSFRTLNEYFEAAPETVKRVYSCQKDMIQKWNVAYNAVDRYMWPPITPREETSTDQAILAMIKIFEELSMIKPISGGGYEFCPGATERMIFQYGDVLTIKKWYSLAYHLLRQITTIGKEDYVQLMMAVYDRFVKFQDHLHENIHRLQGIYKIFYGGFLQCIQALLGSRKIKLDPTKGSWTSHEQLAMKTYYGLQRLRMEVFMHRFGCSMIDNAETINDDLFWALQEKLEVFSKDLETCKCMKTRVVAFFMRYVERWLLSRDSVKIGDFAILDVEGCDWLEFWAAPVISKPQYLLETKRRVELNNSLKWHALEYKRMGQSVRVTDGADLISHDDMCEKQNLAQKKTPKDPNFEQVCKRSRHLHAAGRAAKEMFGENTKRSYTPDFEEDIQRVYEYFKTVGVIACADTKSTVTDVTFWEHVVPKQVGSKGKDFVTHKAEVEITEHERVALEILLDKPTIGTNRNNNSEDGKSDTEGAVSVCDDLSVNTTRSIRTSTSTVTVQSLADEMAADLDDMMVTVGGELPASSDANKRKKKKTLKSKKDQEAALKKLGNVQRYPLDKSCTVDQFAEGRRRLADVVKTREREREVERRKIQLIYDAVAFFKAKMKDNVRELDEVLSKHQMDLERDMMEWETEYDASMTLFDEEKYIGGEYN